MFNLKQFTLNPLSFRLIKRGLVLGLLSFAIITVTTTWATSQQEGETPAFNAGPPAKGTTLPPILGKEQLWGENAQYPFQTHAYELAAKIPTVLHQQPCYCYCDRGMGHNSLHSCFEGEHGAHCSTCIQEAFYADKMAKLHKTPKQIREGIERGEFQQIDYQNYQ